MNIVSTFSDEIGNNYILGERYSFTHDDIPSQEFSGKLTGINISEKNLEIIMEEVVFYDECSKKWICWNNSKKTNFKKIHLFIDNSI
jgi:hypothetical protein